jgi:hypothetical protein
VCEIPNGRFVEAKQENQWLDVRLLWSNPDGGFGSAYADHPANLNHLKPSSKPRGRRRFAAADVTAIKLPLKLAGSTTASIWARTLGHSRQETH